MRGYTFTEEDKLMARGFVSARLLVALVWVMASGQALSDASIWQQRDGLSLSAGMFVPNYDTKIRKSSDSTDGSEIGLEDDLGLDDDDVIPAFSVAFRPWSKHRFFFSYMGMDRDASEILSEDITFDGITFPAGTDVDTQFDIDMYRAGYTWSFLQNETWELGFSVGAYWINMDMKMSAMDGAVDADYDESEPFPMVGFSGSWLLNENWLIRGTAEAFSIDMNDTEGDFYDVRLELEYAFTESLSIGAGYDLVRIDAKDTKKNNKINYDYDGAVVFLRWHL
jgi:hypothetical protein